MRLVREIRSGLKAREGVGVGLCVPFPYLDQVAGLLDGCEIQLGAQNLSQFYDGAYTGEVSGAMLCDMGASMVLVGHSERRTLFGETSADVAKKFGVAVREGLVPILCVGETQLERESGLTAQVVRDQLLSVIDTSGPDSFFRAIVAYEPVWAIGTGMSASVSQVADVHTQIRSCLNEARVADTVPILYGGSVKPSSARELFAVENVDGGLIGGAALKSAEFLSIVESMTEKFDGSVV